MISSAASSLRVRTVCSISAGCKLRLYVNYSQFQLWKYSFIHSSRPGWTSAVSFFNIVLDCLQSVMIAARPIRQLWGSHCNKTLVQQCNCEDRVSLIHNQPPYSSAVAVTTPGRLRPHFTSFRRSRPWCSHPKFTFQNPFSLQNTALWPKNELYTGAYRLHQTTTLFGSAVIVWASVPHAVA